MKVWHFLLVVLMLLGGVRLKGQDSVEIAVISTRAEVYREALRVFQQRYPQARLVLTVMTPEVDCAALSRAKSVFVSGGFWSPAMVSCGSTVSRMAGRGVPFSCTMPQLVAANWRVPPSAALNEALRFHGAGGPENLVGFLAAMYNAAGGKPPLALPKMQETAQTGIYHPEHQSHFESLQDYLSWYAGAHPERKNGPRVGMMFFKIHAGKGESAVVDAIIRAIEKRGMVPVPAFGWPLNSVESLLTENGKAAVDTMLLLDPVMPSAENSAFLEKYGLHAMNLLTTTATEREWRESQTGLPPGRLGIQVGNAERTGVSEPILIAATSPKEQGGKLLPIESQVELAAARAFRWVQLRRLPNAEKRLALIYFNNPPGKATLGASYLNLIPSLHNVVERLRAEGYDTGEGVPDAATLQQLLMLGGRNVGEYAPGELDKLVDSGHVSLLPLTIYNEMFRRLPEAFQQQVLRKWGHPRTAKLMTVERNDRFFFVIPGIKLGNLLLAPQPLRGEAAKADASTHDRNTPPPHAYIAAYLYYQHQWKSDALVHFGRHGTLEWLPGKDVAQSDADAGQALVGDLPHAYYYLVDGGGEFLQAKRRSNATVISHLTPMLASAGIPNDYRELKDSLANYESTHESAPTVAAEHAKRALAEAARLKLSEQLDLKEEEPIEDRLHRLYDYLHELEEQAIPLGMHRIGQAPSPEATREALIAFLLNASTESTKATITRNAPAWADALLADTRPDTDCEPCRKLLEESAEWLRELRVSPEAELDALVDVLNAKHIPSGLSGDPLRTPGALRTGRNMHDLDPRGFPSKAAWAAAQKLAGSLIESYQRKHGEMPKKVSFVLWYGESGRTQGLQEAQALALLGVRPVWNGRGQVADVELIAAKELGRPRVDVVLTMSGLFRDGMPEKLTLLDKAVKLVREAPEDNAIQAHSLSAEQALRASGVPADRARQAARARIFGPPPGAFGVGMSGMMASSKDNGDSSAPAELYLRNMNYAYSTELQGESIQGALRAQLTQNQVVVHGRSSNVYGAIDSDETYQFAGGLNAATRLASGKVPEYLFANARKAGAERYEEAGRFLRRELATRLWNEKWIQAMKESGYAGAQHIASEIEHLYGFRATAPEHVDASAWQATLDTYIHDKRKLGMDRWFQEVNPHARQMLAARLIEIDRQGVYRFSESDRKALLRAYIQSVNKNGVSCYVNACDNRRLAQYISASARELQPVSQAEARSFREALQAAARTKASDVEVSSATPARARPKQTRSSILPDLFHGIETFEIPLSNIRVRTPETPLGWLALMMPVPFGILLGIVRRRLRSGAIGTFTLLTEGASANLEEEADAKYTRELQTDGLPVSGHGYPPAR